MIDIYNVYMREIRNQLEKKYNDPLKQVFFFSVVLYFSRTHSFATDQDRRFRTASGKSITESRIAGLTSATSTF